MTGLREGLAVMQHDSLVTPTRGPRVLCWCLMALLALGALDRCDGHGARSPCASVPESGPGDAPEPIALGDLGPPEAGPR